MNLKNLQSYNEFKKIMNSITKKYLIIFSFKRIELKLAKGESITVI